MKNIKHQLEIALIIEKISCREFAKRHGVTDTHIWRTARGLVSAEPTRQAIEEFIEQAKEKVPFEYPDQILAA